MRPLSPEELLDIWDSGLNRSLLDKSLQLLEVACSQEEEEDMSLLSIGERDLRLLKLREWIFGESLQNMVICPKCNEQAEWEIRTGDLYLQNSLPGIRTFEIDRNSYFVRFRLLDSRDISTLIENPAYAEDDKKILSSCILELRKDGDALNNTADLPDSVWDEMTGLMKKEDPQADISMNIDCPVCGHHWQTRFDIMSFLWAEINNWAEHLLQEIYLLARHFGWSESDILAMSDRRRQTYIQMIGS